MKSYRIIAAIFTFFATASYGQYNESMAKEVNADEYGMKMYVMALLKKGPHRDQSPELAKKIQRAHLDNITQLVNNGKLVLAGPFAANDDGIQGIFLFDVSGIKEAEALTASDPAVKAGRLIMELYQFYGSAALVKMTELHKQIAKKNY